MDESALQERLRRIEQRQTLVLSLLIVPYLFVIGEFVGYWALSVGVFVIGVVVLALVAFTRRQGRKTVEG